MIRGPRHRAGAGVVHLQNPIYSDATPENYPKCFEGEGVPPETAPDTWVTTDPLLVTCQWCADWLLIDAARRLGCTVVPGEDGLLAGQGRGRGKK